MRHLELDLISKGCDKLVDSMYIFADMRTRKSGSEIEMIEKAISIAEKSINSIIHKLSSGISEK